MVEKVQAARPGVAEIVCQGRLREIVLPGTPPGPQLADPGVFGGAEHREQRALQVAALTARVQGR